MMRNYFKDVLFGVAVGDALGVPVEFQTRDQLATTPVSMMIGNGTHNQPVGTWSDDSSLTFCLADVLAHDYDIRKIARSFYDWLNSGLWTPHGVVFDAGITTIDAINKYQTLTDYTLAGGKEYLDNGNGSLMRILPLLFYIKHKTPSERFEIVKEVSSLTHGNALSIVCCFYYLEFARCIIYSHSTLTPYQIYVRMYDDVFRHQFVIDILKSDKIDISVFKRFYGSESLSLVSKDEIQSSGFVLHTLEASIWCLIHSTNYREAVLLAVNLGSDTDTTGAVTGGLAALIYGYQVIPIEWMDVLVRRDDINYLADQLERKYK
jgi:ADP-ribosyl-[dinitrogen reductase] hydrolase